MTAYQDVLPAQHGHDEQVPLLCISTDLLNLATELLRILEQGHNSPKAIHDSARHTLTAMDALKPTLQAELDAVAEQIGLPVQELQELRARFEHDPNR